MKPSLYFSFQVVLILVACVVAVSSPSPARAAEPIPITVTTTVDEDNGTRDPGVGTGTSLREAVNYAATFFGAQTINFDPSLAGQTVTLATVGHSTQGPSALRVTGQLTIQGLAGGNGITIARTGAVDMRLFYNQGTLTLNDLTLAGGRLSNEDGGLVKNFTNLVMNRCTLSDHTAAYGGAIYQAGSATLTNCTLTGNTAAQQGGGIYQAGGALTLTNVTLSQNHAIQGGGLHVGDAPPFLVNTLVADNTADLELPEIGGDVSVDSHHNLIRATFAEGSGGLSGGVNQNLVGVDPLLAPLAAYGGPTPIFGLQPGSPAVDAGSNAQALDAKGQPLATDQRGTGFARLLRGNAASGGATVDIGAFEVFAAPTLNITLVNVLSGGSPIDLAGVTGPLPQGGVFSGAGVGNGQFDPSIPGGNYVLHYTVSDGFGVMNSVPFIVTVVAAPVPTLQPESQSKFAGETATFTALANGLFPDVGTASLSDGAALLPGEYLLSSNHGYQLFYQTDGNLVLYRGDGLVLWSTGTFGRAPGQAVMQGDGNFVLYGPGGEVHFATGTDGNPGAYLLLQDDGNLVIYTVGGTPIFASNTSVFGANPIPSLQWQVSTDGSANFVDIPGENAPTLTRAVSFGDQQVRHYRAVFSNAAGTVPTSAAALTVATPLDSWRALHGLPEDGSEDLANPSGDDVPNLLKFAFNLAPDAGDLLVPNSVQLPEDGIAGLPYVGLGSEGRLVIQFVRRKASTYPSIGYLAETSDDLQSYTALDLADALIESIDPIWERVTIVDPVAGGRKFGRVTVVRID